MTTVTLNPAEMIHGALCGVLRQVQNLKHNRHDKYGAEEMDPWALHINGALAELAVAKYLGLPWTGMGALGDHSLADVDDSTEARWVTNAHYSLLLHPDDNDERVYVLVTGRAPSLALRGWKLGRDGKNQKYWADPKGGRPCYFVPQTELEPMTTLSSRRRRPEQ